MVWLWKEVVDDAQGHNVILHVRNEEVISNLLIVFRYCVYVCAISSTLLCDLASWASAATATAAVEW